MGNSTLVYPSPLEVNSVEALKAQTDGPPSVLEVVPRSTLLFQSPAIPIRRGRKQLLFLQTIDYLAQHQDSLGTPFQPCVEDLLFLFGEDHKRADGAIKNLKRKGLFVRVQVEGEKGSKSLPELLVLSAKGRAYLRERQRNPPMDYPEWQAAIPRITQLLQAPQLRFSAHHKGSFIHIREIIRLIAPLLPPLPLLDNGAMLQIAALNKGNPPSVTALCCQLLGFIDILLRVQGDYLPYETLEKITHALEKQGLRIQVTKRSLYPHIQTGARLFRTDQLMEGKAPFYEAVTRALEYYGEKFALDEETQERTMEISERLRQAGRFSLDPEARALGIIGCAIKGVFLVRNRKHFPLPPELWLLGREQMHLIRKLFRRSILQSF